MSNSGLLTLGAIAAGVWFLSRRSAAAPTTAGSSFNPFASKPAQAAPPAGYQYMNGQLVPITGYALAQPNAATPIQGTSQLISYQRWWEKYVNNGQPAPAGTMFPQIMVPDAPGGANVGHSQTRGTG